MTLDPAAILALALPRGSAAYELLWSHGQAVAAKALELAGHVAAERPDRIFIEQAALLHDIGAAFTDVPELGFFGREPYIRHGLLGAELLRAQGLPRHARVCECHIGVGLSRADILARRLPLPERDMLPESLEEILVCFADKFYSKQPGKQERVKSLAQIKRSVSRYGADKAAVIDRWARRFGLAQG